MHDWTELEADCARCGREVDVSDDGWISESDFYVPLDDDDFEGPGEFVICTGCMTTEEALSAFRIFAREVPPHLKSASGAIQSLLRSLAI